MTKEQKPSNAAKLAGGLSGVAGEYFVAAELSRRGYIATMTLRNARGVDILASNINATRTVGIQVKTSQDSANSWLLNKKAEEEIASNLFYVFVKLNGLASPTYHIVPSKVVATFVSVSHAAWRAKPGRNGQRRNDTRNRRFDDVDGTYLDAWGLLRLHEVGEPGPKVKEGSSRIDLSMTEGAARDRYAREP